MPRPKKASGLHPGLAGANAAEIIDRQSPVPLHHQLAQFLRDGIVSGRFPPNELLPTEQELQDWSGLSRTPIRQALRTLALDGLVIRQRSRVTQP